jgi:hypothetical protein
MDHGTYAITIITLARLIGPNSRGLEVLVAVAKKSMLSHQATRLLHVLLHCVATRSTSYFVYVINNGRRKIGHDVVVASNVPNLSGASAIL